MSKGTQWHKARQKKHRQRNRDITKGKSDTNANTKHANKMITAKHKKGCVLASADNPMVSDHALVRFMERFMEIDIESIRERMLTPAVRAGIAVGGLSFTCDGVTYIVRSFVVSTVYEGTPGSMRKRMDCSNYEK